MRVLKKNWKFKLIFSVFLLWDIFVPTVLMTGTFLSHWYSAVQYSQNVCLVVFANVMLFFISITNNTQRILFERYTSLYCTRLKFIVAVNVVQHIGLFHKKMVLHLAVVS